MARFVIEFDDVMTSKLTKKTAITHDSIVTESVDEFVKTFNELSLAMTNRDGYTKVVRLVADDNGIIGASLQYVSKN